MSRPAVILTLSTVPESSVLVAGQTFDLPATASVVGRGRDADTVIADATISRRHATLRVLPGRGVEVVRMTSTNGVFIDDQPVQDHGVVPDGGRLQLGGVVMRVRVRPDLILGMADADTAPVTQPVRVAEPTRWTVVWDAGSCSIALDGVLLDLAPVPTKVLATLLEGAPEVVHMWDLQERVGTATNLAQAVSGVRAALRERLDEGVVRQAIAERLGETPPEDADLDVLLRRYIANKRGHGYLICASPDQVVVQQR